MLEEDRAVIVLEPGDELIESLRRFCRETGLCGFFFGLGAVEECELAYFDLNEKKYVRREFKGGFEVAIVAGNISLDESGEPIVHAHMVIADRDLGTSGGHVVRAKVSVTMELFLVKVRELRRRLDVRFNLKLITF